MVENLMAGTTLFASARFPGAAGRGNQNMPFPRVAVVNSYGYGGIAGITTSPSTYKRFQLVITNKPSTDPTSLRAANPSCVIVFYLNSTQLTVNDATHGVPTYGGITVYPGWWLTNAGTLLASAVTTGATSILTGTPVTAWPSTPFPILVSDQTRTIHEVMVVTATSLSGGIYTLTVTRGNWNSTATAFAAGSRVGALQVVPNFPTTYYLNVTPFCPRSGSGQQWTDFAATFIQGNIASFPEYDGVFLDSSNTYLNPAVNNADADMNNSADPVGGDGPSPGSPTFNANVVVATASGRGIYNGLVSLLQSLRNLPSNAPRVILTNGSGYFPHTDGMFHENINAVFFSSPPTFFNQSKLFNALATGGMDRCLVPATVINPCVWTTGSGAVTGGNSNAYSYGYATMRLGLAIACMTNTFAAYSWSTTFHGQTWVFDEYYNAQGDCLTVAVLTTDTQLTVHDSSKFHNGDVIRVPHAVKETGGTFITNCEDETMTVNGAPPDGTHINVTRANTVKGTQIVGTAVFTDTQWSAGVGWLGNPKGPAVNNIANLGSALFTESFESPAVPIDALVAQTPTGWVFTATVAGTPPQGTIYGDGSTSVVGNQSVMITVHTPTIASGNFTYFNVKLTKTVSFTVTAGQTYTICFWAKADRSQIMSLRMQKAAGSTLNTQQYHLTGDWSLYLFSIIPAASDTGFTLQFEFSGETGRYWLDNISIYSGEGNIWYRDFDNGLVVLNGGAYNTNDTTHGQAASWKLPAVTNNAGQSFVGYKRIAGSQDTTTNSGANETPGATVSIPSLDALFLLKR